MSEQIPKNSGFSQILRRLGRKDEPDGKLREEKARLEAFLAAVPGEYCGWAPDQSVVYSQGFCLMLGLESIGNLTDIQNKLSPGDSAALEGLFTRLEEDGIPFTINVQDYTGRKTLKLSGVRGKDTEGQGHFHVLWLEDITAQGRVTQSFAEQQKRQQHEFDRLQDSLDSLPFPVWIRDEAQRIFWCNVDYAKKIDARPSEIIAQQKEIVPPPRIKKPGEPDILVGPELARKALETASVQSVQTHAVIGGNRLLMKISEVPLSDRQITLGIAEDRTAEERLAVEIRNNQEASTALLEQLRSAIAIYAADQRLQFYNSAFAQLWDLEDGWLNTAPKLGEIMEKLRETRRLPEQADFRKFKQSWMDMFTGLIHPHEDMLHLPDGTALRMLAVPHKAGGLMMTFEDVTSRLELESSYNTLVAVQKETIDNLAEGVVVYGGDGRLKLWNPAFAKIWQLNPEDLDGEPHITRVTDKQERAFTKSEWGAIRETLTSLGLERTVRKGRFVCHGQAVVLDYMTVPLPDGGVLTTYTDVSDTVRVENALREKNAALEAAERLKLDFLANVSYQLRTPLNAIMGFNDILDREYFGPLNERQKGYTRDIREASDRLLGLINDILDLSSIEAGYMTLDVKRVDMFFLLQNIANLAADWALKEAISLTLDCPSDIGFAEVDELRLRQAIMNLLRNSIAYTPQGGRIKISGVRRGDALEIEIADTGIGIAEADQGRVLQPFERVESGTQGGGRGAGLGLSLVQNIIALHGGRFDLKSVPGQGTRVTISLIG